MENRDKFGPSIDIQHDLLPSARHLLNMACNSGEFAISIRGNRSLAMRMVKCPLTASRPSISLGPSHCAIVCGATQVNILGFHFTFSRRVVTATKH